MLKFARWLVSALFVSAVMALVGGGIASEVAKRSEYERNPHAHSVHYQNVEEQMFRRVVPWTAVSAFFVLIFASKVKLPESTRAIAMGALAGVVIAVFGGQLVSALRGEPGVHMKRARPTIAFALQTGVPVLGTLGGVAGYVWHRQKRKPLAAEQADITSHTSADTTAP